MIDQCGVIYSDDCKEILGTTTDFGSATIVIPKSVKTIKSDSFKDCQSIKEVIFEGKIECIEKRAFAGCTSLKAVSFKNWCNKIESLAFSECDNLEEINIPCFTIVAPDAFDGVNVWRNNFVDLGLPSETIWARCDYGTNRLPNERGKSFLGDEMRGSGWQSLSFKIPTKAQYQELIDFCKSKEVESVTGSVLTIYARIISENIQTLCFPQSRKRGFDSYLYYGGIWTDGKDCNTHIGVHLRPVSVKHRIKDGIIYTIDGTKVIGFTEELDGTKTVVIEDGVTHIGDWAFFNCPEICRLELPKSIMTIGKNAFGYVNDRNQPIKEIVTHGTPDVLDITVLREDYEFTPIKVKKVILNTECVIPCYLLDNWTCIEEVIINSTFSVVIKEHAFQNCTKLQSVKFNNGCSSIKSDAFKGCLDLQDINLSFTTNLGDKSISEEMLKKIYNRDFKELGIKNGSKFEFNLEGGIWVNMIYVKVNNTGLNHVLKDFLIMDSPITIGIAKRLWDKKFRGSDKMYYDTPAIYNSSDSITSILDQIISLINCITGKKFRLPTKEEWEYAAKGGVLNCPYRFSGSNDIDTIAWYNGNVPSVDGIQDIWNTPKVKGKKSNALGIFDMSGLVNELCADGFIYVDSFKRLKTGEKSKLINPCFKGGSILDGAEDCQIASTKLSNHKTIAYGIRLVLPLNENHVI